MCGSGQGTLASEELATDVCSGQSKYLYTGVLEGGKGIRCHRREGRGDGEWVLCFRRAVSDSFMNAMLILQ